MNREAPKRSIPVRIRRLSRTGEQLYIQFGKRDLEQVGLHHGDSVRLQIDECNIQGIVKTSGGTPWLAPDGHWSNKVITERLRGAGLEHGANALGLILDDGPLSVASSERQERPDTQPAPKEEPSVTGPTRRTRVQSSRSTGHRFDLERAKAQLQKYNSGTYRGWKNVDLDEHAYQLFSGGVPDERLKLVELIRFVGEDYGGAQARFLPAGFVEESERIGTDLFANVSQFNEHIARAKPIEEDLPEVSVLQELLSPFQATKFWLVWATKFLHFLRPATFPILDSRAEKALGITRGGNAARHYRGFMSEFRDVLLREVEMLNVLRELDGGESPTDVKLLDKVLYEAGR